MKIAICDDDKICRSLLSAQLNKYIDTHKDYEISVSVFSCAKDLLNACQAQNGFDVYILDIMMPNTNGIDLGMELRKNKDDGIIIYLTSSKEFAIESYNAKASNYLLKPIDTKQLFSALDEAYVSTISKAKETIWVKTKNGLIRIPFENIMYVELCKRIAIYHLTNDKTVESLTLRVPFSEAMQELLTDKRFSLCAQGILVNVSHIYKVESTQVTFTGNQTEYFSKKVCQTIRSLFTDLYISK